MLLPGDVKGSSCCVQKGECTQGTPIKSGNKIRLQHMNTRRWLHSHKFPSPLSGNQEVGAHHHCTEEAGCDGQAA